MRRTSFRSAPLGPDFLTDLAHEQIRRAAGLRGLNALGGVLEDDRVSRGDAEVLHGHKEAVRRGLFVRDLDIRQQQVEAVLAVKIAENGLNAAARGGRDEGGVIVGAQRLQQGEQGRIFADAVE